MTRSLFALALGISVALPRMTHAQGADDVRKDQFCVVNVGTLGHYTVYWSGVQKMSQNTLPSVLRQFRAHVSNLAGSDRFGNSNCFVGDERDMLRVIDDKATMYPNQRNIKTGWMARDPVAEQERAEAAAVEAQRQKEAAAKAERAAALARREVRRKELSARADVIRARLVGQGRCPLGPNARVTCQ